MKKARMPQRMMIRRPKTMVLPSIIPRSSVEASDCCLPRSSLRRRLDASIGLLLKLVKVISAKGPRNSDRGTRPRGIPKIFADIEDLHTFQQKFFTNAGFLEMTAAQPVDELRLAQMKAVELNALGWRYIPKVGGPGTELSQPTLFPQRLEVQSAWVGSVTAQWTELKPEQNPRQWHIIKALVEMPIIKLAPVSRLRGVMVLIAPQARVLE